MHEEGDLHPVADAELRQQLGDVGLHRPDADVQLAADLGVRGAAAERERHLVLARAPIARLAKANGVEHQTFADQMLSTMGASTGRLSTPEDVARLIGGIVKSV
jgi:hypothetical protein